MALCFLAIELLSFASSYLANLVGPAFLQSDPDGVFLLLIAHHTFLLILTLLVMKSFPLTRLTDWGVNFKKWKTSLLVIAVFAILFGLLEYSYMRGGTYSPGFPLTTSNKFGWQIFQYFFSGLGEEPLFRGLVIVLLLNVMRTTRLAVYQQHVFIVVVSTALFMFAHLDVDWLNLSISGFEFGQQTKAFQLGILYAIVFIHTKSLFAPIVLHGLSNGLTASIGFYVV